MWSCVDVEQPSRSGSLGLEYPDGVLVVDKVVEKEPLGANPVNQGVGKSRIDVGAQGCGNELTDGDKRRQENYFDTRFHLLQLGYRCNITTCKSI